MGNQGKARTSKKGVNEASDGCGYYLISASFMLVVVNGSYQIPGTFPVPPLVTPLGRYSTTTRNDVAGTSSPSAELRWK